MALQLIDPDDKLDYSIDWVDWVDSGIEIDGVTPVWSIFPTGPTLSDQVDTVSKSTIFLSLCTLGVVYELSCKVNTDASTVQIAERSWTIRCEQR